MDKNKQGKTITIAGAGPAGMTAAILLAKAGFAVRVYEQRAGVGSRFNDDFQGLENWSREQDVLDELRTAGIEPAWWSRPYHGGVLYDPELRPVTVDTARPLFYMVRRGGLHPGSLDLSLLAQAQASGVELVFNQRVDTSSVDIVAGGPRGAPAAIAAGMTFETDREDFACGILHDELAPSGYVYFLIADGQATLATVLFKNFNEVHACMQRSIDAIAKMFGIHAFPNAKRWGGYGGFTIPRSCEKNGALWIGEAAGFQDFLFGFGIRNALISAKLAAESIITGQPFDPLWQARLLPHLKASLVNRVLYDRFGNLAKRSFWRLTGKNSRPDRFMTRLYNYTPLHKLVYPLVKTLSN
ncbi:MAG: NAD(P)/FAD-dependent oxidoreductase [Anaerolineae bacterium]|nr:NAD(P)/FAD-dependent oxidoreductase [Anaerolineae bacterium]